MSAPEPLLATVRCIAYSFESEGTRSERVLIRVQVLSSTAGKIPERNEVFLLRYTQGDPFVKPGGSYLVAAYKEWEDHHYLTAWAAVDPADASAALEAATRILAKKMALAEEG